MGLFLVKQASVQFDLQDEGKYFNSKPWVAAGASCHHRAIEPRRITPARGPPLWDDGDAKDDEGVQVEPDRDLAAQAAPDCELDQSVNW